MKQNRPDRSLRDVLGVVAPASLVAVAGFMVAYQFVDPAPPDTFVLATGAAGGAYHGYGERFREQLARDGIRLEIRETAGSVENIRLLRSGEAQVGFVQGGVAGGTGNGELVSLASLYFEPLWLFHREAVPLAALSDLGGRRLAVGPDGSGTRAIVLILLAANGIGAADVTLSPLTGNAAVAALRGGELDALFTVSGPDSDTVRGLLEGEGIALMSFERAAAYTRLYPFLSSVTLHRGVIDLARDVPSRDMTLVAPAANLVARGDFHPALVDLLMADAATLHRPGGLFEDFAQFPSPKYLEFPLSEEAQRYFESGPSFLHRVLPFWAATLLERLMVMLLPLVALLIPLLRIMPPVYRWRIRHRIYRWYRELLSIDPVVRDEGAATAPPPDPQAGLRALARIEEEVARVHVPLSYADQLYTLRVHLQLVRDRLEAERSEPPA